MSQNRKNLILIVITAFIMVVNLSAFANNTTYIMLSNQIARKVQLGIVANNVANANTLGFEQDSILLKHVDIKQNSKRSNSFVYHHDTYRGGDPGDLKVTNNPLDLAVAGDGYFKVLTPRGERYTLNGSVMVNSELVLVNTEGLPFASIDNQPIALPADYIDVRVAADGTVVVDGDEVGIIGIFTFEDKAKLRKEGNHLNLALTRDIVMENPNIVSGALRASNVSSARAMTDMIELQRSSGMATNMLSEMAELERTTVNKFTQ